MRMSRETRAALFWAKVSMSAESSCWEWTGARNRWGYGATSFEGKQSNASRVAWLIAKGPIPAGQVVCHRCDNPACCNPGHLFLGTQAENLDDCRQKGRSRGCPNGRYHPRSMAKLDEAKVIEARRMYAQGLPQTQIAARMGVHSSTISRAVRGERWSFVEGGNS